MAEMNTIVAANLHSPRFSSSKFSAPKAVPHLVPRARLHDRLDRGLESRLTLVVASPGGGQEHAAGRLDGRPAGLDDWLIGLETIGLYAHAFLGDFPQARQFARP